MKPMIDLYDEFDGRKKLILDDYLSGEPKIVGYADSVIRNAIKNATPLEDCGDCVDRQAVLEEIENGIKAGLGIEGYEQYANINSIDDVVECIRYADAVIPKQRVGQWIPPRWDDGMSDPIYYQVRCSECGFDLDPQTFGVELKKYGADRFCPKCGAKMGGQE